MSPHVWAIGSSDQKVRIYDLRNRQIVFTLQHGHPVDDVHILPGGLRAVTVGGPDVQFWDFMSGGTVFHRMSSHAKATTCLAVDKAKSRIVTGGLDGYAKVFDLDSLKTQGILSFGAQILSLDVSLDGRRYAVGMVDGAVEIRAAGALAKKSNETPRIVSRPREFEGWGRGFEKVDKPTGPKPGSKRYFNRGPSVPPSTSDAVINEKVQTELAPYDVCLRKFEHSKALDVAVKTYQPNIVVAVIDELANRGNLVNALSNRDLDDVIPLLKLIRKHVRNPRYSRKLTNVLDTILDIYANHFGLNREFDTHMMALRNVVMQEVKAQRDLSVLLGMSDMIRSAGKLAYDEKINELE